MSAGVDTPAAWTGSGGVNEGVSVGTAEPVRCSVEPESLKTGCVFSADRLCSAASMPDEEFLVD